MSKLVGGYEENSHPGILPVPDLTYKARRVSGTDDDFERRLRCSKRRLYLSRVIPTSEDETEVAVTFGQGHDATADRDGDLKSRDTLDAACLGQP